MSTRTLATLSLAAALILSCGGPDAPSGDGALVSMGAGWVCPHRRGDDRLECAGPAGSTAARLPGPLLQVGASDHGVCVCLEDGRLLCRELRAGATLGVVPLPATCRSVEGTCATLTDGSVHCWGWPAEPHVMTLDSAQAPIAASFRQLCALRRDRIACVGERVLDRPLGDAREGLALGSAGAVCTWASARVECTELTTATERCARAERLPSCHGPERCVSEPRVFELPDPVRVVRLGTERGCALTVEGELWCWGAPWEWAHGEGFYVPRPPTLEARQVTAVDVDDSSVCVRTRDGATRCWGPDAAKPEASKPPGAVLRKPER